MPRQKSKTSRISVFKGREAKLNKAILYTLAFKGPLTIYEICKETRTLRGLKRTEYTNVNRRVRALEQTRYLRKIGSRRTLAGFQASLYELTPRGYAAFVFNQITMDRFIKKAQEDEILQALVAFVSIM